jgi:hypothetical protein
VSLPSTATPARLQRRPFVVLLIVATAGLWLLDTRHPAPWPEAATPWFEQIRAIAPASQALDAINARDGLTPDLPLGSALVLLAIMGCTLATLLTLEAPVTLALSVALGVGATRSLWSTLAPGRDALPIAVVAGAVLVVARAHRSARASAVAALAGVALAPAAAWITAPGASRLAVTRRGRWLTAIAVVGLSACVQVALLQRAWASITCLAPADWTRAVVEVLRPGRSADASASLALRQALSVVTGDVHLFGLMVAALGWVRAPAPASSLRRTSLVAVGVAVVAIATGLLAPALGAALLLPWWAVWFGLGLAALSVDANGRLRPLPAGFAVVVTLATPLLRHATVAPAPWIAGMPTVTHAVGQAWRGGWVASEDHGLTRRLRLVGADAVPADAQTLGLCVDAGRSVYALGPTVQRVESLGYRIAERPLRAPLSAVIDDLRADQLVALAMSPSAGAWVGPAGLARLQRLTLTRDALLGGPSVGVVARTDRGGERRTGRTGIDLTLRTGDIVGGRPLLRPISVSAHDADADVDSGPERLAAGRHAALAVFDRSQHVALRSVGVPAAGLLLSLMRHADWRQVQVAGRSACVPASRDWTRLSTRARRLSVPTAAASPRRPVVLYLASASAPAIGVTGLPVHPLWPGWSADAFDTRLPDHRDRLRVAESADGLPPSLVPRATWVTRVAIEPRGPWDAHRVGVSAGVAAEAWIVRLAASGLRADTTAVCEMASTGDRLLQGQYGVLDDESEGEVAVRASDGWHAAERLDGAVFQWTAHPVATASFHLDAAMPLTLAMDATGAGGSDGPQPVRVRLNGRVLRAAWQGAARIDVDADAVRVGENTISLEVARVVQPERDSRAFGVLVRQLRVIGPVRP